MWSPLTASSKNGTLADFVPVVVNTWPVTYIYAASDLLLAYGVAFLCALSCSAIGLYAFYVNNASYQNLFSTYVRATNDSDIRSQTEAGDDGADPLPKAFAISRVALGGLQESHDTDVLDTTRNKDDDVELQRLSLTETDPSLGLAWNSLVNEYDPVSLLGDDAGSSPSREHARTADETTSFINGIHRSSHDSPERQSQTWTANGDTRSVGSHNTTLSH